MSETLNGECSLLNVYRRLIYVNRVIHNILNNESLVSNWNQWFPGCNPSIRVLVMYAQSIKCLGVGGTPSYVI
jgi:hypothetical protein